MIVHVGDFQIAAPSKVSFTGGTMSSISVTLTSLNNFVGTVTLTTSVNATGLTVGCPSSASLTANGTASVSCSLSSLSSTTQRTFNVNITGTSGPLSHSALVTVTVTPSGALMSAVTDASGCSFGSQFRLIFVQNNTNVNSVPIFELVASNPGQFAYNIFFTGTPGTPVTLTISIPYPFVTQGSVPTQVFTSFGLQNGCFVPLNNTTGNFTITAPGPMTPSGAASIVISNYNPQTIGSTVTLTVSGTVPLSGMVYVNIHLNYGLKGSFFGNSGSNATNSTTGMVIVPNGATYTFSATVGSTSNTQTVSSQNAFKGDPGIAGIVLDQTGTPVANALVSLYDSNGSLISITFTDRDGFFAFAFNAAHKATFTVQVSLSNGATFSKTVTVKPNHLALLDFTV